MKNNLLSEKLIYTGESQTPTHLHLCTYNLNEMQESSGTNFHEVSNSLNNEHILASERLNLNAYIITVTDSEQFFFKVFKCIVYIRDH